MSRAQGFAAVSRPDARVLILGSMPGRPSLAAHQYYANPRNAFWRIMATVFDFEVSLPYPIRLKMLQDNHVALWDVVGSCYREGSLDSAIQPSTVEANAFAEFFTRHNQIRVVCFNGAKADQLWRRHVAADLAHLHDRFTFRRLPSTSPAHAAMPYDRKLEQWLEIKKLLQTG